VTTLLGTSSFVASGLSGFDGEWFTAGKLTFTSGANAGNSVEVKSHRNVGNVTLSLWQVMPEPIAPGDTFVVTAGCDKRSSTCRGRFANLINFRGFPHVPGNDFVVAIPRRASRATTGRVCRADVFLNRQLIVVETRDWIGTPYRHQASLKGVGCDCLGLVRGSGAA